MADVLRRNIEIMREQRRRQGQAAPWPERLAQQITNFAGSMKFVLLHLLIFGGWIISNLWGPAAWRFDPTLVVLAMAASVEAIFLSTFVLISQNRMSVAADGRAELDLQINLLAEHEITRLVDLVGRLAAHAGLTTDASDLDDLRRDVAPEVVLDHISQSNEGHP